MITVSPKKEYIFEIIDAYFTLLDSIYFLVLFFIFGTNDSSVSSRPKKTKFQEKENKCARKY